MPALVGKTSYLKEAYRVLADDIQIDPTLVELPSSMQEKQEEILTEDVQIYVPQKQVKKSDELTEKDFAAPPYRKISLDEINFGDIITTNPHSKSAYEVRAHKGDHLLAVCLYNQALPKRVGEEFYFKVPYLIERATEEVIAYSSRRMREAAA